MILDNVDDGAAVAAVSQLLPRLKGGHVIVTARAANFPPAIRKLELQACSARTPRRNSCSTGPRAIAARLATMRRWRGRWRGELGGLALGLEQAGAHIATERDRLCAAIWSFGTRRATRRSAGPIRSVTGSEKTLATVWTTSVARLAPESRRLLDRLAFLAPDPVPNSLLDVAVPGEAPQRQVRPPPAPASTLIR